MQLLWIFQFILCMEVVWHTFLSLNILYFFAKTTMGRTILIKYVKNLRKLKILSQFWQKTWLPFPPSTQWLFSDTTHNSYLYKTSWKYLPWARFRLKMSILGWFLWKLLFSGPKQGSINSGTEEWYVLRSGSTAPWRPWVIILCCLRSAGNPRTFTTTSRYTSFLTKTNNRKIHLYIVRYSTLLHLAPLRFHCVGGCWDRTQDCCDFVIDSQTL